MVVVVVEDSTAVASAVVVVVVDMVVVGGVSRLVDEMPLALVSTCTPSCGVAIEGWSCAVCVLGNVLGWVSAASTGVVEEAGAVTVVVSCLHLIELEMSSFPAILVYPSLSTLLSTAIVVAALLLVSRWFI